ncbi:hypothetical protein EDD18DRAFT_1362366 [Armillaria luteobubalina]|uniref:RING-type domain-containing protein n=1 Tax=Armillaria luteobubalina TaxID=153913 RepID=A0AA39UHN0_9AGAR|nr:hypothetical protein EDD18DRAFT_1362366 [Armillaria luteobubalina]
MATWQDTRGYKITRLEKRLDRLSQENSRKTSDIDRLQGESTLLINERDDLRKCLSDVHGKLQSEQSSLQGELQSVRFELQKTRAERDFFVEHLRLFSLENLHVDRNFLLSRLRQVSQTEDLLHEENNALKLQRDQAVSQLETELKMLKELTCCPICIDGIKAPVFLKCGHDFCGACLFDWVTVNPPQSNSCPTCRKNINSSPVFPRSLADVAEKMWGKPEGLDIGMVQHNLDNHAW